MIGKWAKKRSDYSQNGTLNERLRHKHMIHGNDSNDLNRSNNIILVCHTLGSYR